MPLSNMCRNSSLGTLSLSAGRRRGGAEVGGPRVMMWCATLCLTAACFVVGRVMSGYSLRMFVNGDEGKLA